MASSSTGYINTNGYNLFYEKFGSGTEIVLLIPGTIGIASADFDTLLTGQDAFDTNQYTFIGIDLPGWGRSTNKPRQYDSQVFNMDAECCAFVMKELGYNHFSIISWSHGAAVALVMCFMYPNLIRCAVVIGALLVGNEGTLRGFQMIQDVEKWPNERVEKYLQVYVKFDSIKLFWNQNLEFIRDVTKMKYSTMDNPEQYAIKPDEMMKIRMPILLIHGNKDPLVGVDQVELCQKYIPVVELYKFEHGSHDCHQKFPKEFKKIVENFFENSDNLI